MGCFREGGRGIHYLESGGMDVVWVGSRPNMAMAVRSLDRRGEGERVDEGTIQLDSRTARTHLTYDNTRP